MNDQALGVVLFVLVFMGTFVGLHVAKTVSRRAAMSVKRRIRRARRNWWRNLRRRLKRVRWDPASPYGVYVYDVIAPTNGAATHGKFGEGNINSRLASARTVTDIDVRRVHRTASKADGYVLEQRIKAALTDAGLMLPRERAHGSGVEKFRATPDAYRIIDEVVARSR